MTVIPWRLGHPLAWDATVCDSTAPTYRSLAASGAELVAKQAEDRKTRIYQALNATHIFIPIAIETSGVFGGEALAFFKDIGYRMRSKTQDPQSFFHLCQQISVCIQQFNSVSVLGSCSM